MTEGVAFRMVQAYGYRAGGGTAGRGAAGRKAGRNGWRDGGRYSGKREKPGNYGSGFKASEKIQGSNPFVLFPADERQRDRRCHRKKGIDDNVAADERQGIVEKKSEGGVSV